MTSERSVGSCSHNSAVKILCGKGWLQAAQHPHERRGAQTFHINGKIGYSQELKSNCIWDFKWLKCVSIQSYINTISFRTSRHNPRKPDARALGRQRRSLRTPAPDTEPLGLYTGAGKGIFTVLVRHPGIVDLQQVQQNPLAEYCEVYVTSAGGVVCGMNMNDSSINSGSWRVRTANTDQKLYFAIRNNVTLDISQQGQKYPLVIQHGNGQPQLFIGIHVRNIELTG